MWIGDMLAPRNIANKENAQRNTLNGLNIGYKCMEITSYAVQMKRTRFIHETMIEKVRV